MGSLTRTEAAAFLAEHDRYLILTHRRPDGDTVGSAAALCLGLRRLGKQAHVLRNMEITEKYSHLHSGLDRDHPRPDDTLVSVDVAAPELLPEVFMPLRERIALRIDHHGTATAFAPLELVDPQAGACGEIIYDLLCLLGVGLDKAIAGALYTAVSTDTGGFRYANTTAHTYRVAAACAETGADLHAISQRIFETNSLARLRLQGWMVEHIRFFGDGRLAVCALPLAVEKQLGVTEDDLENISGFPRSILGVELAATLRQTPEGKVKLSVRALPGYDAAQVCAAFGGGGHKGAGGATLDMPLEAAARAVAQQLQAQLAAQDK